MKFITTINAYTHQLLLFTTSITITSTTITTITHQLLLLMCTNIYSLQNDDIL